MPPSKLSLISDDDFAAAVANSTSWLQVMLKCSCQFSRPSGQACKNRATSMKLDTKHINGMQKPAINLKFGRRGVSTLRTKMRRAGVLEICSWCRCEHMDLIDGKWMWYGKATTLHIDHIHGKSKPWQEEDDRLDNLRFLCYNCHTQTPTSKLGYKINPKPSTPYRKARRILKLSGKEYTCEMCKCEHMEKGFNGAWEWRGWMLNLQCDHIDGDRSNNDISNLRWLCPNCHTTTDTYSGGNKKRKREQIEQQSA